MGLLKDWAVKQSRFLRIAPGESIVVQFLDFKIVENRFNPEETIPRYIFLVSGQEKTFETRSIRFAEAMDKIKKGAWIEITRRGEGPKTTYEVKEVEPPEGLEKEDYDEFEKMISKKEK